MPSLTNLFASLACLMAVATAVPCGNTPNKHHTDCEAGKSYFKCGTIKGCFAKDPCADPVSTDDDDAEDTTPKCTPGATGVHFAPTAVYEIYPQHADVSKDASSGVHLETYKDKSQVEQVLAFKGIPADAKNCAFGWKQGERIGRTFIMKGGEGLATVRKLSGFPGEEEGVSFDSVKPFDKAEENVGSADFTNWDTLAQSTHTVGPVDCAEALYFKVGLKNEKGETSVYLGQNDDNGYFVSYSC